MVKSTEFKLWCFWEAKCGFECPAVTLVSLNKTLNHWFVLQMGRKAVGPMCCVTHVKDPSALIEKKKGFARVFLAVAAECAEAPCKVLHNWVSELSLVTWYNSESLYIPSTLFGRYVRYIRLQYYRMVIVKALNYTQATQAMASVAPGLGLGAPSKVSHWF